MLISLGHLSSFALERLSQAWTWSASGIPPMNVRARMSNLGQGSSRSWILQCPMKQEISSRSSRWSSWWTYIVYQYPRSTSLHGAEAPQITAVATFRTRSPHLTSDVLKELPVLFSKKETSIFASIAFVFSHSAAETAACPPSAQWRSQKASRLICTEGHMDFLEHYNCVWYVFTYFWHMVQYAISAIKIVDTWDPEIQWIQCFPRAYASGGQVHIGTAAQRLGQVVGSKDALSHGINQWLEDVTQKHGWLNTSDPGHLQCRQIRRYKTSRQIKCLHRDICVYII